MLLITRPCTTLCALGFLQSPVALQLRLHGSSLGGFLRLCCIMPLALAFVTFVLVDYMASPDVVTTSVHPASSSTDVFMHAAIGPTMTLATISFTNPDTNLYSTPCTVAPARPSGMFTSLSNRPLCPPRRGVLLPPDKLTIGVGGVGFIVVSTYSHHRFKLTRWWWWWSCRWWGMHVYVYVLCVCSVCALCVRVCVCAVSSLRNVPFLSARMCHTCAWCLLKVGQWRVHDGADFFMVGVLQITRLPVISLLISWSS